MRFRCCGGLEPPDWLLATLPLLSRLPAGSALQLSAALAADVDADAELLAAELPPDQIAPPDARAAVAALRFVLCSAAKHDAQERELRVELEQLGVGLELAAQLAVAFERRRTGIREQLRDRQPSFARVQQVAWGVKQGTTGPVVELALKLDRPATLLSTAGAEHPAADVEAFVVRADKFLALEEDLRHALAAMQSARLA